ncbi:hypothetical protein P389DRAFT_51804 [Cystobasidium minutum MCA 4210]|uniref:uncharacterized protein n=1 Tax=Cystobasidium minutum MCA 4210 TaxID=1397322 RepID=UPI0034CF47DA|eukprot:jgi/Rhomi1/51804/CE51803_613
MAVELLSPSRSSSQIETLADEEVRRMNGQEGSMTPFTYPVSKSISSNGLLGEPTLMDRQRSSSRISLRPSYETLNTGASSTSLSMSPSSTTVNGSIISAAPSVAAIGKVNVTDPWGTAWGMDSPYDASVAYASNPNRITMRQSAYFGSGLTLAALASGGGGDAGAGSAAGSPYNHNNVHHNHPPSSSSSLHPLQATAASSPAPSSFSSISGSAASSANTNVWSEASSSSSAYSHFNGNAPPSAPWLSNDPNGNGNKPRSASFQGDLSQFSSGQPSPTYSTQSEGLPQSSSSTHHYHAHAPPIPPNLRARSTTHLPSLIHHRHSGIPLNRRTTSTPGSEADRSAFRKSFIGGSVVNQSGAKENLPPVPVDPKLLAKMSSKKSLKSGNSNGGLAAGAGTASSRASIMSSTTDRTDAYSTMSGTTQDGSSKKSKRKSWFARSPSSLSTAAETLSSNALASHSAATHSMLMGRSNTRQSSTESSSATGSGRPPSLSRASSSFGTNSSPPPPTPPIPDTLPLPPSLSLGEKSKKSSNASLRQRIHAGQQSGSAASTPSPGLNEMMPSSTHPRPLSAAVGSGNNLNAANNVPATPLSARMKTSPTPSLYGTPLTSPSNAPTGAQQVNSILASTAPISSSPLSTSPMTSPTSALSHPLKPAALARPAALQLSTLSENTMFPDSFPSPETHHDALRRAEAEGLAASTRTARANVGATANGASAYVMPAQPAVTMSLPPTPIVESTPVNEGQENALAPAAVIKPSPSSPPALGSLAALANAERSNTTRSPTATPSSTRARASPSTLPVRKDSRPNTPIDQVLHEANQSVSTLQAVNIATPRSTSQASTDGRSTYASPPTSIASRKRSNNSLKATLSQAPPSPQPSSAIVEHVSNGNLLVDVDDQFMPVGSAVPPASPALEQPALQEKKEEAPPPIPHQPGLDTSLSSFQVRKAFPDHRNISTMPIVPMPRKSSAQSILPEAVPLPDSPALGGSGFDAPPHLHTSQRQLRHLYSLEV